VEVVPKEVVFDLEVEAVPLLAAAGRCLAESVEADRDLPPYDRVMMDGVVVRRDDWELGKRSFVLAGVQTAGTTEKLALENGMALEVMTGAVCPVAINEAVIVPVEYLESGLGEVGDEVSIDEEGGLGVPLLVGKWIHAAGSDREMGAVLVEAGQFVSPAVMGILASVGCAEVSVYRRVKVALVSTGDELVEVEETPGAFQIRRSNDVVMKGFVEDRGAEVVAMRKAGDEREEVEAVVAEMNGQADVILFVGGASKGRRDWVPEVLTEAMGEALFHGAAQRPGKPFGVWRGEDNLVLALPGNPVSVLSCLCRYVGPLLDRARGLESVEWKRLAEAVEAPEKLTLFQAVSLDGSDRAMPIQLNNSGDFSSLLGLSGVVEVEKRGDIDDLVSFYPL